MTRWLLALAVAGPLFADSVSNLSVTVDGTGGLSAPIDGISASPFWWITTNGGVPGSVLADFGFDPLMEPGALLSVSDWSGSLLVTSPFDVENGSTLSADFKLFQSDFADVDVGFSLLLKDSIVQSILWVSRPDGRLNIGDFGPIPGTVFVTPGPSVAETTHVGGFVNATLGNIDFGPPQAPFPIDCRDPCSIQVHTSVAVSGTYQLAFGAFSAFPLETEGSGLALQSISVPEPDSRIILLMVLSCLVAGRCLNWTRRRRRSVRG